MLENLDDVDWANYEHAYGPATDVPDLLRKLLDPDPRTRSEVIGTLYSNVFHQGTRYPATPYVIPFLVEMCANPQVPARGDLLSYWGSLITGYFSVQERPTWGDGERIFYYGELQETEHDDPFAIALHEIYRESLKATELLFDLLDAEEPAVRAGAAWVLACLPTVAESSVPRLEMNLTNEPSEWIRAAIAFALGELGAADPLWRVLSSDQASAPLCMAACELARIAPSEALIEPLLNHVSEPIEDYDRIPGAGGKSTGDAAFSISYLPRDVQQRAVVLICDQLDRARSFDTMPLVNSLLVAAFDEREEPLEELSQFQRLVLSRMVNTEELWSIGNLHWTFKAYGLPQNRDMCAKLVGVKVADDEALAKLRWALSYADLGFLEEAREGIADALEADPAVFERIPAPDECWLLCAKAFAEADAKRAIDAFERACSINRGAATRVDPRWTLAKVLDEADSAE